MTPSDPLYYLQWHFALIGDIETIWDEYTGLGVNVGVYDTGVDYTHADLDGNYDSSLHVEDNLGNPVDPFPSAGGAHGTACAGLIAAEAGNGEGGVGVAHGATITGVDIFDSTKYGYVNSNTYTGITQFIDVVNQAVQFDVMSNSWGITPGYGAYQSVHVASQTQLLVQAYATLSETGRFGLGTIVAQASGNDNRNANGDGANSSRHTITVAATDSNGVAASYSNYGAGILVAAPAAAVTTDISGEAGYSSGDYTYGFGGTSAATPVTAGVISLMLEANSDLGWRDVQNILATSASLTGGAYGGSALTNEDGVWYSSGVETFNGGGHTLHDNYGFGMVDAFAAVRMAEVWTHMTGGSAVSANSTFTAAGTDYEQHVSHDSGTINLATVNYFTVTDTQSVIQAIEIENIQLTIDMEFSYNGTPLEIYLVAPDGTRFEIVYREAYYLTGASLEWTFEITGALGMSSVGDWTLEVTDIDDLGDVGQITDWQLDFYGSLASTDDIHTLTDDYLTLAAVEGDRLTIEDSNGGSDWLNMAALQGDIILNLRQTTGVPLDVAPNLSVDGTDWGVVDDESFENIVTGDGNDIVLLDAFDNEVLGMRGNDSLSGGIGNDTLDGGAGQDTLRGEGDDDTLLLWSSAVGEVDVLDGGNGTDTADFSGFASAVWVDLDYGSSNEAWTRDTSNAQTGGGTWRDIADLVSVENLTGTAFEDRLIGNSAANTLRGGLGSDLITAEGGNDTLALWESAAGDTDTLNGGAGTDTADFSGFASAVWVDLDYGSSNEAWTRDTSNAQTGGGAWRDIADLILIENLTGTAFEDRLIGNSAANTLRGGLGSDLITAEGGNDTLALWESAAGDTDTLNGGAGTDTADFSGFASAVWVDLDYGSSNEAWTRDTSNAQTGGGTWRDIADLVSVENLTGTAFEDRLIGNSAANTLRGGLGSDLITAEGGNDTLALWESAAGDTDTLNGGAGTDTADFSGFASAVWVDLDYGANNEVWTRDTSNAQTGGGTWRDIADLVSVENLTGTAFEDRLIGNSAANTLRGGLGSDLITAEGGNDTLALWESAAGDTDTLNGGAGTDTADFSGFASAVWVDLDYGANNEVWTRDTSNAQTGGGTWRDIADLVSVENLTGTAFDDRLIGDNNANVLTGGGGNDELTGEGGSDQFVFAFANDGTAQSATITDFDLGSDVLTVNGFSEDDFYGSVLFASFTDGGGTDTTVTLSTGDFLIFESVTVADLEGYYASI